MSWQIITAIPVEFESRGSRVPKEVFALYG